ncbi:hypothetical protein D3C87_1566040 [compost metagenome]
MVDTCRSPKAEYSAVRTSCICTPSALALSRSIDRCASSPDCCESLVTSRKIGSARIFAISWSDESCSWPAFTLCNVYW